MTDRTTTTCSHSHTVTLRLNEGDPLVLDGTRRADSVAGSTSWRGYSLIQGDAELAYVRKEVVPEPIRAELEAALAVAEASCGGRGCADRLRAEAERLAPEDADKALRLPTIDEVRAFWMDRAADFLDAAPDARGSDLSAEQPEVRASDLTGVYQSTSEPKTTMDDWLAARHDDQEATDG